VPTLLSPNPSATLDNGCRHSSNSSRWSFAWSECDGADLYQIEIRHPDFGVYRSEEVASPSYRVEVDAPFVPSSHWSVWSWRVRSHTFGAWRPWSEARSFRLEPVDTDCRTGVELFEDTNYRGRHLFLEVDPATSTTMIPVENLQDRNFEDILSSLKLYNLRKVIVYDRRDRTGRQYEVDHDCPNVETHSQHGFWHDIVSSLEMYR
jgi:hypothetical protein